MEIKGIASHAIPGHGNTLKYLSKWNRMEAQKHGANSIEYPEIYLAIDNCFASKRYAEPDEWMGLIRDLGVINIEASADTELDPLYMGRNYLRRWVDKVQHASAKYGVSVCNLYSGHGTYATLGLAHADPVVRDRLLNKWMKPMMEVAANIEAGLGFFCHAFGNRALQDPCTYNSVKDDLIDTLAEIARFSGKVGCKSVGLEQMYSPHQIPWTIKGARDLIREVSERSEKPLYITIDTGHQSGQDRYLRPTEDILIRAMEQYQVNSLVTDQLWLGPDSAFELLESCEAMSTQQYTELVQSILNEIEAYPFLFAEPEDSSPYMWLQELACYSPIIHLQQTDGKSSAHMPFTSSNNENGIIEGRAVLKAIKTSYENNLNLEIPKVEKIYLTIEVFPPTASINYYTLRELHETIAYWRQFVPEDGKKLNELI
jgi:sugar phosphate isomerase/epimerase